MDGWMVGCWMLDVGWMVGESGIKANSAQFSWSLAELGKKIGSRKPFVFKIYLLVKKFLGSKFQGLKELTTGGGWG